MTDILGRDCDLFDSRDEEEFIRTRSLYIDFHNAPLGFADVSTCKLPRVSANVSRGKKKLIGLTNFRLKCKRAAKFLVEATGILFEWN